MHFFPSLPSFPFHRKKADPASVMVHVINGEHPAAMQHGNSSSNSIHGNRNSNFLTFHLSKWLLSSPTKMLSAIPTLLFVALSTVMCINFSMRWFMYGDLFGVESDVKTSACEWKQLEKEREPQKKKSSERIQLSCHVLSLFVRWKIQMGEKNPHWTGKSKLSKKSFVIMHCRTVNFPWNVSFPYPSHRHCTAAQRDF